jgi:hypothetical protein
LKHMQSLYQSFIKQMNPHAPQLPQFNLFSTV